MGVTSITLVTFLSLCCFGFSLCNSASCPCSDTSLCNPVSKIYEKELFAFSVVDGIEWKNFNWDHLSAVAVIGNLTDDFLCYAHSRDVRLIKMVGIKQIDIPKLVNPDYRANVIKTWLMDVQENFMDGINMDLEQSVYYTRFKDALVNLTREANAAFKAVHPQYQITWDVPYSPRMLGCITGWCYDFLAISKVCDFLVVMSYDAQLNVLFATANSPIHLIEEGYQQYINKLHVSPEKLVMAVPWYGYDFACKRFMNHTGISICISSFSNKVSRGFRDMRALEKSRGVSQWSTEYESPYFTYMKNGSYQQCWYDNVESLTYKYKFAVQLGLHGIGMFTADCVDYASTDPGVEKETRNMWDSITYYLSELLKT